MQQLVVGYDGIRFCERIPQFCLQLRQVCIQQIGRRYEVIIMFVFCYLIIFICLDDGGCIYIYFLPAQDKSLVSLVDFGTHMIGEQFFIGQYFLFAGFRSCDFCLCLPQR